MAIFCTHTVSVLASHFTSPCWFPQRDLQTDRWEPTTMDFFFYLKTNVQHPKFKEGAEHRWVSDSAVDAGSPCHPSATSPLSSAACSIWLGSAGTALLLPLPSSIPSCQAVPRHQLRCSALGMPAAPASNTTGSIQAQPPPCAVGLISWDKLPVFPSPLLLLPELCRLTRSCWNLEKSN